MRYWWMIFLFIGGMLYADFYVSQFQVAPSQLESGESGQLTFTVVNLDSSNSLESLSVLVNWPTYLEGSSQINLGDIPAGGSITYSVPFRVSDEITPGIYSVSADFYGLVDESGSKTTRKISQSSSVYLLKLPVLQLSLDNNEVSEISDSTLIINNKGGLARKVSVYINSSSFGFLNVDHLYIGDVDGVKQVKFKLDSRAVPEGPNKIPLLITYEDEFGNFYSEQRLLSVIVRKESGDFIFSQEEAVVTGREDELKLKIKNEGNDVRDLRFSILDDNVQMVGLSEYTLGDLKSGQSLEVSIPVIADTKPGSVPVRVYLKWVENNENMEGFKEIPLKVKSDAEIGVYLEGKPLPLTPKTEHTITLTVSNKGSYPIEAVSVSLDSDVLELLNLQQEQYMGGLNGDDFSSVQYKVRVKDVQPGSYPVKITVAYRDASGEWVNESFTRSIRVNAPVEEDTNLLPLVGLVVVILGGVYWFKFHR